MTRSAAPPEHFEILGGCDVEEFAFASLSWEKESSKTGSVVKMGFFDQARAAKQVRFINKNEAARVLVVAYPQEDSARLCNVTAKGHAEAANIAKAGADLEWQQMEAAPVPEQPIRCVLAGGGPERREEGEVTVYVPKGAECLFFKWFVKVDGDWEFAGQSYADRKKNVVFIGLGEAGP